MRIEKVGIAVILLLIAAAGVAKANNITFTIDENAYPKADTTGAKVDLTNLGVNNRTGAKKDLKVQDIGDLVFCDAFDKAGGMTCSGKNISDILRFAVLGGPGTGVLELYSDPKAQTVALLMKGVAVMDPLLGMNITASQDPAFIMEAAKGNTTFNALRGGGTTFVLANSVPEPTGLALLGIGIAGLCASHRRRKAA